MLRRCGDRDIATKAGHEPETRTAPRVADNWIYGNTAAVAGGGIRFCYFYGTLPRPTVERNFLFTNHAADGAGMFCYEADSLVVDHCAFHGNMATGRGGALMSDATTLTPYIRLVNCTLNSNQAQALVFPPGGGGVFAQTGNVEIVSTIVASNTGGGLIGTDDTPIPAIISDYCDVWSNGTDYYACAPGAHSISGDPFYCPSIPPPAARPDDDPLWGIIYQNSPCNGTGWRGNDIGASPVGCYSVDGVVFYDNFSDQADDDWFAEELWPQQVDVESGEYSMNSISGAARSYVGDLNVEDLEFSVWVNPKETQLGGATTFCFRMDPVTHDRYEITIETELQRGTLVRWEDDLACIMTEFGCPVIPDGWHELMVLATDTHLEAFWMLPEGPGIMLFSVDDVVMLPGGTISLGVEWRSAPGDRGAQHTHFDRVMVRDMQGSGVEESAWWPRDAGSGPAVRVVPNPSRDAVTFQLSSLPAALRLDVFDVQGRLVRTILHAAPGAGTASQPGNAAHVAGTAAALVWDGRDNAGRLVRSGIYTWRLMAAGEPGVDLAAMRDSDARGRVILLR